MATDDKEYINDCPMCVDYAYCQCEPDESTDEFIDRTFRLDHDEQDVTMEDLDRIGELLIRFETRQDTLEELIANLVLAHSQMAAQLEAIIVELMAPRSEEEKKEFRNQLQTRHLELLALMQEAMRGVETDGLNDETTVETVADRQPPTPSD